MTGFLCKKIFFGMLPFFPKNKVYLPTNQPSLGINKRERTMKKKILIATAAVAATAAFGFETWNGGEGLEQVKTELGNDTKTFGYWFSYDDNKDGGKSNVSWPVPKGNEYDKNSLQPIITECSGVCGTANLDKGTLTYNPFVGIGFNVVGETSASDKTPAAGNATAWGGVCIVYSSQVAAMLEMGQGDKGDNALKNGPPFVDLKKGDNISENIPWSKFAMPDWAIEQSGTNLGGEAAAATLVALKFKIQAEPGQYTFNIQSIGPYNGGCKTSGGSLPTPSNDGSSGGEGGNGSAAIGDVSMSSAKAILSGRTLSFSGISNAKVEILNLQGQIVMKGSAASSMNLMGLDAGVYMVRIAGKAVNMSQKILVK